MNLPVWQTFILMDDFSKSMYGGWYNMTFTEKKNIPGLRDIAFQYDSPIFSCFRNGGNSVASISFIALHKRDPLYYLVFTMGKSLEKMELSANLVLYHSQLKVT